MVLKFNTGRTYTPEGQIIVAKEIEFEGVKGVMFFDSSRDVDGFIHNCKLTEFDIMKGYDSNSYQPIWGSELSELKMEI